MKEIIIIMLAVSWLLLASYTFALEPNVQVEVTDNLKITAIKHVMEEDKEEGGQVLVVEVTIQNVGSTPAQFIVFASAKEEGGWASGRVILPGKGQLAPRETVKGKIKTGYKRTELPSLIKIEGSEKMF